MTIFDLVNFVDIYVFSPTLLYIICIEYIFLSF